MYYSYLLPLLAAAATALPTRAAEAVRSVERRNENGPLYGPSNTALWGLADEMAEEKKRDVKKPLYTTDSALWAVDDEMAEEEKKRDVNSPLYGPSNTALWGLDDEMAEEE